MYAFMASLYVYAVKELRGTCTEKIILVILTHIAESNAYQQNNSLFDSFFDSFVQASQNVFDSFVKVSQQLFDSGVQVSQNVFASPLNQSQSSVDSSVQKVKMGLGGDSLFNINCPLCIPLIGEVCQLFSLEENVKGYINTCNGIIVICIVVRVFQTITR